MCACVYVVCRGLDPENVTAGNNQAVSLLYAGSLAQATSVLESVVNQQQISEATVSKPRIYILKMKY